MVGFYSGVDNQTNVSMVERNRNAEQPLEKMMLPMFNRRHSSSVRVSIMKSIGSYLAHAFFVTVLLVSFNQSAFSMDLEYLGMYQKSQHVIKLSGSIEIGDATKFDQFIESENKKHGGEDSVWYYDFILILDSPGGNYLEAVDIGKSLQSHHTVATYVDQQSTCLGACAIIWLAGKTHLDPSHDQRWVHPLGVLGFHSAYLNLPEAEYSSNDILIASQWGSFFAGELIKLSAEWGFPIGLVVETLQTPANDFLYIDTIGKVFRFGGSIDPRIKMNRNPYKLRDQVTHACINDLIDYRNSDFGRDHRWGTAVFSKSKTINDGVLFSEGTMFHRVHSAARGEELVCDLKTQSYSGETYQTVSTSGDYSNIISQFHLLDPDLNIRKIMDYVD